MKPSLQQIMDKISEDVPSLDAELSRVFKEIVPLNVLDRRLRAEHASRFEPVCLSVKNKLAKRNIFAEVKAEKLYYSGDPKVGTDIVVEWSHNADKITLHLRDPRTVKDVDSFVSRVCRVVSAVLVSG